MTKFCVLIEERHSTHRQKDRPYKVAGLEHLNSSLWKKIGTENILQIAEFALMLPGTSAHVERVFSQLKILWSLYTNNEQVDFENKSNIYINTKKRLNT